jgi:hypothetical protein
MTKTKLQLTKQKKRVLFFGGIFVVALPMLVVLFKNPQRTEAGWWNDSWQYRVAVPVTNNTSAETSVYISFNTGDTTHIDTSDTAKFQADCGDLRFTTQGGKVLPYYIVNGCSTANTEVNVYLDSFPEGDQIIYYYYGNPSAADGGQGSNFSTEASDYSIGSEGSEEKTSGPIGYWAFDDGQGTTAQDSTVSNNDATLAGGTSYPSLEKQINIINQQITTAGTDAGIIFIDSTAYSNATFYFEVVAQVSSGTGSATLTYNAGSSGTPSGGSTVTITNISATSFTRYRSASFSPSNAQNAYVSATTGTGITINSARIIIEQPNAAVTATETQVEVGDNTSTTSESATAMSDPKYFTYDHDAYNDGTVNAYFEATIKSSAYIQGGLSVGPTYPATVVTYADTTNLYDDNDWDTPTEISDDDATYASITSNQFDTDDYSYVLRARNFGFSGISSGATIDNVKVIVEHHREDDLVSETLLQLVNHSAGDENDRIGDNKSGGATLPLDTDGTATYSGSPSVYWNTAITPTLVQSANFGVDLVYQANGTNAEVFIDYVTIEIEYTDSASGTAYAELYNKTNTATVGNGTVSTSTADWVRVRGASALSTNWDTTNDDEYEVRIYSSDSGATTYITDAKVIIQQSDGTGLTTTQILQQYNNTATTDTDDSYTSKGFDNQFDPTYFSGGDFAAYFESTLKTSNGSNAYYAQLDYGGGIGEVTASDTGYTTKTSSDIWSSLPSSATDIDVQLKNAAASGTTTTSSNSWLKINATNLASTSSDPPAWKSEGMCISGMCLYFDGVASAATVTNSDEIDFDSNLSGGVTFQTWIKVNSDGEGDAGEIFEKGADTYMRITNEGSDGYANLEASLDLDTTPATVSITDGITLTTWHNVAMTYTDDGDDEISVYIDGSLMATSTVGDGSPDTDANDLLIGGSSDNNFHGFIDEFKVYTSEKSSTDIAASSQKNPSGSAHALGYSNVFLGDGLVGYWKMDDNVSGDSQSIVDYSGNGNTGTTSDGDASLDCTGAGRFSYGCDFDGSDDVVRITESPELDLGELDESFSLSIWVKTTTETSTTPGIFGKNDGSGGYYWEIYLNSVEQPRFGVSGGGSNSVGGSTSINDGQWHHLMAVRDIEKDKLLLYLDGKLDDIDSDNATQSSENNDDISIGSLGVNYTGNPFEGNLDEARIYNRALSPSEVDELYRWGPAPVGYWNFDEGSGDTAYDKSGNGFNATLYNNIERINGKFGGALQSINNNDTQEYAQTADHDELDFSDTQDFTYSAWVKLGTTENNYYAVMRKSGGTPTRGYYMFSYSAKQATCAYRYDTDTDTVTDADAILSDGDWHYVTCLMDRSGGVTGTSGLYVYVDGVRRGDNTSLTAGDASDNPTGVAMAEHSTSYENDTAVDEVKIYNYARSPSQILEDMNAGHPLVGTPVGSAAMHLRFDEGYSTNVGDQSGHGNSATISGASWSNDGKFYKALDYDGTDDVTTVSADNSIDLYEQSEYTVCGWIYPDTDGEGNAGEWYSKGNSYIRVDNESGGAVNVTALFDLATTDGSYSSTKTINTGQWSHVCVTYADDGDDEISMYINGVLDGSSTMGDGSPADDSSADLYIGGDTSNNFDGKIDEVKIYAAELTTSQIITEHNQGKSMVLGAISTDGTGAAMSTSNSAASSYCPPGDTTGYCEPPVAEWNFDEKTGSSAYDTSENSNTGTLGGGTAAYEPSWQSAGKCKRGACLNFDGDDDYINIGHNSTIEPADVTIELWIKPTDWDHAAVAGALLIKRSVESDGYFIFYEANTYDTIHFDWGGNAYRWNTGYVPPINEWTHMVFTRDTSGRKLFINGVLENSTVDAGASVASGAALTIGGATTNYSYNGAIDEIRIYNYARTQEQIAWDYNKGAPVGWWKLDENEGSTAYDQSGNGNTGTISGSSWVTGKFNSGLKKTADSDKISVSSETNLSPTGNFSIGGWFYDDTFGDSWLISKQTTTVADYTKGYLMRMFSPEDAIYCARGTGATQQGVQTDNNTISTSSWNHIMCTFDGTYLRAYINGKLSKTSASNTDPTDYTSTSTFTLMSHNTTDVSFTNGIGDDIRVYNYALTPLQIASIYNLGAVRFE